MNSTANNFNKLLKKTEKDFSKTKTNSLSVSHKKTR